MPSAAPSQHVYGGVKEGIETHIRWKARREGRGAGATPSLPRSPLSYEHRHAKAPAIERRVSGRASICSLTALLAPVLLRRAELSLYNARRIVTACGLCPPSGGKEGPHTGIPRTTPLRGGVATHHESEGHLSAVVCAWRITEEDHRCLHVCRLSIEALLPAAAAGRRHSISAASVARVIPVLRRLY
jgi:hypothetical protein